MSRLLTISGSPRRRGNTSLLLERVLQAAQDKGATTDKIILNDLCIKPCQSCGGCLKTGTCVIKDDMTGVYDALAAADIVVVASPIYFGSVSAQTKLMVDRLQCLWVRKYLLKKKPIRPDRRGAFLSCGGFKKDLFFKCARTVIDIFFKVQDIAYEEELFAGGVDEAGEVLNHKDVMRKAYYLTERLLEAKR